MARKFWPEVADALADLNVAARAQLATRPRSSPPLAAPWPTWAPAPDSWVREAHRGTDPAYWIHGPTWHIASDRIIEFDLNIFSLKLLCGRAIRVQPEGIGTAALAHGCRSSTFDVRGEAALDDKDCADCLRRQSIPGRGLVVRPYGDPGGREFTSRLYASLGPDTATVPHWKVAQAEHRRVEREALAAVARQLAADDVDDR